MKKTKWSNPKGKQPKQKTMTGSLDIAKGSIRVVKHPTKNKYGVVYFDRYGRGLYAMNINSSTSRWYGHSKTKAYGLAKKLRNRRK